MTAELLQVDPLTEFCRDVARLGHRRQRVELDLPLERAAITAPGTSVPQAGWPAPRRHPSVLSYARRVPATSGSVFEFTVSQGPITAAEVNEGALKPETEPTLAPQTARLRTLAAYIRVSRNALEDGAEPLLRGLLQEGLDRGLERRIFAEVAAQAAGAPISGATLTLESLQQGLAAVAGAGYLPTAISVDAAHRYTLPPATTREGAFYDVALVLAPAGSGGDVVAIVGDWQSCVAAQRGTASVELGWMDATNATQNLVTLRIETEVAVAVTAPRAFASIEATG